MEIVAKLVAVLLIFNDKSLSVYGSVGGSDVCEIIAFLIETWF